MRHLQKNREPDYRASDRNVEELVVAMVKLQFPPILQRNSKENDVICLFSKQL
jgi:hypothetical protein